MSRLRKNPKHLIEGFFIFEANPNDRRSNPRLCYKITNGSKVLDVKEIGRFCQPYGNGKAENEEQLFTFTFTDEEGYLQFGICYQVAGRYSSSCKGYDDPSSPTYLGGTRDVLCIISNYPWTTFFAQVVRAAVTLRNSPEWERLHEDLVKQISQKDNEYRFGQMQKQWVKVKLPKTHSPNCAEFHEFAFRCPDDSTFPALSSETTAAFQLCSILGHENMLKLFAAVLMERRIIVLSKSLGSVSSCILLIDQLLYPFAWQHTYIPVMPQHVKEVCCAMMPYIVGIHKSLEEEVMEILAGDSEDFVVVDIDARIVKSPFCDEKRIPGDLAEYLSRTIRAKYDTEVHAVKAIVEAFANFFVALIGHYADHIQVQTKEGAAFLNEPTFLKAVAVQYQPFLVDLIGTQQFRQFVDERCDAKIKGSKAGLNGTLFEQLLNKQDVRTILEMTHRESSKIQRTSYFTKKNRDSKLRSSLSVGDSSDSSKSRSKRDKFPVKGPVKPPLRRASQSLLQISSSNGTSNASGEPSTYREYITLVSLQMEKTCRELNKSLTDQKVKDAGTTKAMQATLNRFKLVAVSWKKNYQTLEEPNAGKQKLHSRMTNVKELLEECTVLHRSVRKLSEKQETQNASAIHGITKLKFHWAGIQKNNDEASFDATSEGSCDKVVEYLYWLLTDIENIGDQHELANNRRDICVSEANRILCIIEKDIEKDLADRSNSTRDVGSVSDNRASELIPHVVEIDTKSFDGFGVHLVVQVHGSKGDSDMIILRHSENNPIAFAAGNVDKFKLMLPQIGKIESVTVSSEFHNERSLSGGDAIPSNSNDSTFTPTQDSQDESKNELLQQSNPQSISRLAQRGSDPSVDRIVSLDSSTISLKPGSKRLSTDSFDANVSALELSRIIIYDEKTGNSTSFECSQKFSRFTGLIQVFYSFGKIAERAGRMKRRSAPVPRASSTDSGDSMFSSVQVQKLQATIGFRGVGASSVPKHFHKRPNADCERITSKKLWKEISGDFAVGQSGSDSEFDIDTLDVSRPTSAAPPLPDIDIAENDRSPVKSAAVAPLSPRTPQSQIIDSKLLEATNAQEKQSHAKFFEVEVTLQRPSLQHSYGLGIGTNSDQTTVVTSVTPGGYADGKLKAGDRLLRIDGKQVCDTHSEVIKWLKLREQVHLLVLRKAEIRKTGSSYRAADAQKLRNRAKELAGDGMRVTYNMVKTTLIQEFGERLWMECREDVRSLLEQLMDPLSPVPGRGNPELSTELILERAEVLAGNMPYSKIRTALIEEFTLSTWERAKDQIKAIVRKEEAKVRAKEQATPKFTTVSAARDFAFKRIKEAYSGASNPPTYISIKDKLESEIGSEIWGRIQQDIENLLRIICGATHSSILSPPGAVREREAIREE